MNLDRLKKIAKWCVGDNNYSFNDIVNNNFLTIQILNNKCHIIRAEYLPDGRMEQRQYSICKMIESVCSNYCIPNLIFSYCTYDRTNNTNGSFFTHAKLIGTKTKNVLAPCFTFYGYPEKNSNIITKYKDTWEILKNKKINWNDKHSKLVFVGSLTKNNHRESNIPFDCSIPVSINNQGADSPNFLSREYLSNFKYLLHLNGNGGAYASRFKYLLGANSLALYNCNSGNETNMWQEWWMKEDVFQEGTHYVLANNVNELKEKINYYNNNDHCAKKIAENGYNFFVNNLNPTTVENFWALLLHEYKNKCNFEINQQLGNLFEEKSYGE
jgi:hypothetical protein